MNGRSAAESASIGSLMERTYLHGFKRLEFFFGDIVQLWLREFTDPPIKELIHIAKVLDQLA